MLEKWIPQLLKIWRCKAVTNAFADQCTDAEVRELAGSIASLTQGLGVTRAHAGERYLNDRKLLGAYLLYFWPVSYAQAQWCLSQAGFTRDNPPRKALDLGCGPGPVTAALVDAGAQSVMALDHSERALAIVKQLVLDQVSYTPLRCDLLEGVAQVKDTNFDCIIMGHVLNELWEKSPDKISLRTDFAASFMNLLSDNGSLVIFEPAALMQSRDLIMVRDALVKMGYYVSSPCTKSDPCPALCEPSGMCHVAAPWDEPALLKQIARLAGGHRDLLKMAYLIVRKKQLEVSTAQDTYRVVSDLMVNKAGRLRRVVCGPKGRFSISAHPNDTFPAVKALKSLYRGELITVSQPVERGEGWGIGESTVIAPHK